MSKKRSSKNGGGLPPEKQQEMLDVVDSLEEKERRTPGKGRFVAYVVYGKISTLESQTQSSA